MSILGELVELSGNKLYQFSQQLQSRHIIQDRSHWRAVLPTPIANRLAANALNTIPLEMILNRFSINKNKRLMVSFSRRLGYLHDNQYANEIIEDWLSTDGILRDFSNYSDDHFKILKNMMFVNPNLVLSNLREYLENLSPKEKQLVTREFIINTFFIVECLAKLPECFDQCVTILLNIYFKREFKITPNETSVIIGNLFKPKYSESSKIVTNKKNYIESMIHCEDKRRQKLGLYLLDRTLKFPQTWNLGTDLIGARPHSINGGNNNRLSEYSYDKFIQIATKVCNDPNEELSSLCRRIFAENLPDLLWHVADLELLVNSVLEIHNKREWVNGWQALRARSWILRGSESEFEKHVYKKFCLLEKKLRPTGLLDQIKVTVLDPNFHFRYFKNILDDESTNWPGDSHEGVHETIIKLGERYLSESGKIADLGGEIFSQRHNRHLRSFGMGLAKGSKNRYSTWNSLVDMIHTIEDEIPTPDLLIGFIEQVDSTNPQISKDLLDSALEDEILVGFLVKLHPVMSFTDSDFLRCIKSIDHPNANLSDFGSLLYTSDYKIMNEERKKLLFENLLMIEGAEEMLITAVSSNIHQTEHFSENTKKYFLEQGLHVPCEID